MWCVAIRVADVSIQVGIVAFITKQVVKSLGFANYETVDCLLKQFGVVNVGPSCDQSEWNSGSICYKTPGGSLFRAICWIAASFFPHQVVTSLYPHQYSANPTGYPLSHRTPTILAAKGAKKLLPLPSFENIGVKSYQSQTLGVPLSTAHRFEEHKKFHQQQFANLTGVALAWNAFAVREAEAASRPTTHLVIANSLKYASLLP